MLRPDGGVALLLALLGAASPAWADQPADGGRLRAVQDQLETVRKGEAEARAEKARLAAEMARLRRDLVGKAAAAQDRERDATRVERRLAALAATQVVKVAALDRRRSELSGLLAALTQLSRNPPVGLLAGGHTVLDAAHAGQVLAALVPQLKARAAALGRDLADLAQLRDRLTAERAALAQAQAELAAARSDIDRLLRQRAADAAALDKDLKRKAAAAAKLSAEAKSIEALVAAVEEERQARAAATAARAAAEAAAEAAVDATAEAEAAVSQKRTAGPVASAMPLTPEAGGRFVELRGRLGWPAAGTLIGRFGEKQDNGLVSRGARLATRPGAQVTAPAGGEIAFAGPFKGYGTLLILAYGDGYHLLLAGLERVDAVVGQNVLAGEPLGQMGQTVNGARPTLYVELRHNGEPVDFWPWLASRATKVSDR